MTVEANVRHVPPIGSAPVQSMLSQQVVEHLRAPLGMLGSTGLQMPLSHSVFARHPSPRTPAPVPIPRARQILIGNVGVKAYCWHVPPTPPQSGSLQQCCAHVLLSRSQIPLRHCPLDEHATPAAFVPTPAVAQRLAMADEPVCTNVRQFIPGMLTQSDGLLHDSMHVRVCVWHHPLWQAMLPCSQKPPAGVVKSGPFRQKLIPEIGAHENPSGHLPADEHGSVHSRIDTPLRE